MIFTLHKYIFRELLRVFILAALGLTFILSLGSILQPIQEFAAGPRQVIILMGYFMPITLTFVLPMAALFAGALVYSRLAADNELAACRASGISLVSLVYPGLILAIIVTVANLFLSFYVMPVFVLRAEKSLKADAKQIVFRNIERRKYYGLPPDERYLIYADQVNAEKNTLLGVVVAEMQQTGIQRIIAAEAARVSFNLHGELNEVRVDVFNQFQIGVADAGSIGSWTISKKFGSLLGDSINFKKINEMRKIKADPMLFDPVAQEAYSTYRQLYIDELAKDINRTIHSSSRKDDPNNFYEMVGEPNSVRFTAGLCVPGGDEEVELSKGVVVVEYDTNSNKDLRTLTCREASLHIEGDSLSPTLTMDMSSVREEQTNQLRMRNIIRGMVPPQNVERITSQFRTQSSLNVKKLASEKSVADPSKRLAKLQFRLRWRLQKAMAQIKGEIHSRLVFGLGCIPMILIGIGLGILKKDGHLLSAFAAGCVPAAVLIVCIMSGKQMVVNTDAVMISGVALMWAGFVFMVILTGLVYHVLLKH
jgi:lipopolysaccharide export LptBFGC system permease protein LptF